jgi:hypothetical protein
MPNQVPPRLPTAPRTRRFSDYVAIIGVVIIGAIIIWGLVHAARLASPWFASLFSSKVQKIEVSAPDTALSGTAFNITWKYSPTKSGHYAFLFPCNSGALFKTEAAGGGMTNIPCGAAFSIPEGKNTMTLTPSVAIPESGIASVKVPLSIVFIPADKSARVGGSDTITINSASASEAQKDEPKPVVEKPTTKPAPVASGPTDLSVRIINISADPYGNGFVEFDVANVGGSSSGTWYFEVNLPTDAGYTFFSQPQASLAQGDHIVNTMQFTQLSQYGGIVSIQIDPANLVRESSEGNNYASQQIGTGIYYPQPYQY